MVIDEEIRLQNEESDQMAAEFRKLRAENARLRQAIDAAVKECSKCGGFGAVAMVDNTYRPCPACLALRKALSAAPVAAK